MQVSGAGCQVSENTRHNVGGEQKAEGREQKLGAGVRCQVSGAGCQVSGNTRYKVGVSRKRKAESRR